MLRPVPRHRLPRHPPFQLQGQGQEPSPSPSTSSNLLVFRLILQGPLPPSDGFDLYFAQPYVGQTGFQLCDPQKGPACVGGQTYERNFLIEPGASHAVAQYAFRRDPDFGTPMMQITTLKAGTVDPAEAQVVELTYMYPGK